MNNGTVSFIGLGVMGFPMAGHLVNAGYTVNVFNRTTSRARIWTEKFGGKYFLNPKGAVEEADAVFICVGDDNDVRSVVLGHEGVLAGMQSGTILIDHTTASAEIAREISVLAQKQGVEFLDAPVSGGQQGAENGTLTVMVGGDSEVFSRGKVYIKVYARACELMGTVGAGQLTKMVNQICIAGLVEGLSEGLGFAKSVGLDPLKVIDVIRKGAAQSWQMENRFQTMVDGEYNHGFAVDWMRKDLAICLSEGRKNGIPLPVTAIVDQLYSEVQLLGGGRWDTSSLLYRLEYLRSHGVEKNR